MQRDLKSAIIVAASLVVLAVACKLFIPRDLPWGFLSGRPLGSRYDRLDNIAFRMLFSLGFGAAFLAVIQALLRARS